MAGIFDAYFIAQKEHERRMRQYQEAVRQANSMKDTGYDIPFPNDMHVQLIECSTCHVHQVAANMQQGVCKTCRDTKESV